MKKILVKVSEKGGGIKDFTDNLFREDHFNISNKNKREKEDSVILYQIGNSSRSPLFDFLINKKSTRIIELHDLLPRNKILRRTFPRILKIFLYKSDLIIVHSNHAKNMMGELYGKALLHKTIVIPHYVFPIEIVKDKDAQNKNITFLVTGVIKPSKGIELILKTFYCLPPEKRKKTKLILAGKIKKKLKNSLMKYRFPELELIDRFLSEEELNKIISNSDFVFNLKTEDLGESSGIVSRAISLQTPIISSNIGENNYTFADSRLRVEPEEEALRDLLLSIIKEPKHFMHHERKILNILKNERSPNKTLTKYLESITVPNINKRIYIINNISHQTGGTGKLAYNFYKKRTYNGLHYIYLDNLSKKIILDGEVVKDYGEISRLYFYLKSFLLIRKITKYRHLANQLLSPLTDKNSVIYMHDVIPFQKEKMPIKIILYKILYNLGKNSNKIITISEYSKRQLINLLNIQESKIEVIYPGIDRESFNNNLEDKDKLKVKLGLSKDRRYILFVGDYSKRKNLQVLLKSFVELSKEYKDIDLIKVGRNVGDDLDFIEKELAGHKLTTRIIKLTDISDSKLAELYKISECLVYPSLYEGFGLPPIEAMACGCPVICSNSTCLPEIVGDSAILFNPKDEDELNGKIKLILTNKKLKESIISKGIKKATKYNLKRSENKLKYIYNELTKTN